MKKVSTHFFRIKIRKSQRRGVICCKCYKPDDASDGTVIHLLSDTGYGCESRSRFWPEDAFEMAGFGLMVHCIEEIRQLEVILPGVYEKEAGK